MMQNSQENRLYSLRSPDAHRLPAENPKKNVLKTYNPKLHNFGYEHQQKQKNTGNEVYAEKSTPSDISTQSVLENNDDIFHVIPTLKHLLILAECQSFDSIGINEYYSLLSILKIRQACEGISGPPKYFKLQNATDQIKMEDFVAFFTSDVQDLDITKYSREELVLKFGLEIFRAMSKENIFLELRDLVNYIKEHNKLDVDLTSMLEIFDFFTDPDQGMLKTRTTLIDFFHKNALRLARALSMDFLNQLRRLTENKKTDGAATTRKEENVVEGENKGSNIIKIYDSTVKCNLKNRPPTMINIGANNKEENGRDLEKVGQGQINFDKNLLDMDHQFFKLGISEVFQEILPKNRGWLMRKSNRYENKWSMVFFEVKDNKLISTKPTSLKKSIDVKSIEIHKCNLLEVMKRFDPSQDSKKGTKKGNSHSRVPSKKDVRLTTFTKMDQEKPDYLFFIIDKATHKTYLIKSPDNLIIGSIIRFYIMKDLQTYNGTVQLPASEPEYSGVIEIAVCKKSCIHKYHSSLKSYSFRKQFLIIKHGKFNIYEMKTKDSFDLLDYETKTHSDYDLLPQTNQYIFSLEKMSNLPHDLVSKRPLAAKSMMPIQEVEPFSTERVKTLPYLTSPKFNQEPINFGTPQIHYEDLKVIEYKNNATSKGFFSSIIHKIQSTIKKDSKIVLACDTELKRRQWVLTLKFFSQLAQSALFRSSFTKDSGVSAQEDSHTLKNSFQTEYNHSLPDNAGSRTKHKKKPSSISIKHKATYNPDFIDVYKAEDKGEQQEGEQGQEQEQEQISPRDIEVGTNNKRSFPLVTEPDVKPNTNRKNLPLITEPDASQHFDSEELLMTFQFGESLPFMMTKNNTLNNRIIDNFENEKLLFSNEIKSMSDVEIWQRFLMFFMQEKHSCAEFDLNNAGEDESTELVLGQDTEELEEDASIRQVVVSDFSVNKRS